jgi:hypothetical protein
MAIFQGYKRLPNGVDIEGEESEAEDGYDHTFHLSAPPGIVLDMHGDGYHTYQTALELRLRLCKFGRLQDWTRAAFANLAIMRTALTRSEHYDGTYTRALLAVGDAMEVLVDDQFKIVVQDRYTLNYRIDGTFQ